LLYLSGICIGVNAAIISVVTEWLSDMKMGFCSDGWWLNQQFCCWEIEGDEMDGCESWQPWTTVFLARWIVFILISVSMVHPANIFMQLIKWSSIQAMFAFVASHLVRNLAKYAAGSGISEIKCILAGFIMKGYLGFATFFIKSITLVCFNFFSNRPGVL